jgi:ferric-dicitrate binding protein FerR (iron transport regulator)
MKKVEDYLQHAAECREMARKASPAHRQQLEQMAETWEQLARVRRQQLAKRRFPGHQQSGSPLSRR